MSLAAGPSQFDSTAPASQGVLPVNPTSQINETTPLIPESLPAIVGDTAAKINVATPAGLVSSATRILSSLLGIDVDYFNRQLDSVRQRFLSQFNTYLLTAANDDSSQVSATKMLLQELVIVVHSTIPILL